MGCFKVGDYVKSYRGIGKVVELDGIKTWTESDVTVDYPKYGRVGGYTSLLQRATVLDYIRILDAERIVSIHIGCNCCMGCHDGYTCRERRVQWLNQSLTDEIIKLLGGSEE